MSNTEAEASAIVDRPTRTSPSSGGGHAIVIGASMAGLLAARVLCDHFARVTLIERDALPAQAENRKGVPQGRHLHALHAKGEQILCRLFPGLGDDLTQAGAVRVDVPGDFLWFHFGGYNVRFNSGLTQLAMSRPLLESHVRRRVLTIANLTRLEQHDVAGLLASPDRTRVVGVTVRPRAEGQSESTLNADLVVDATGRGSRTPMWLESLGYPKPPETTIGIGYGYTTRLYRQDPTCLTDARVIFIQPTPPHDKRLGGLYPIEGGRWIVTLGGYKGGHAPADEQGFLDHAKSLAAPDIYNVIRRAEPISDFVTHGVPSNLRRHYEKLARFPEGYLVMGDAMCSFNPIYGQGMTVSAMEADLLDRCLAAASRQDRPRGIFRAFFDGAAKVIDNPWMIAVGGDFLYAGVEGKKALGTDLINWYVGHAHNATHRDPAVATALIQVLMLLKAPSSLFHPRVVLQVLKTRFV